MSAVPVQELEAITVRRARVADAGKVRYRVYSTPTEFIAVIAESALMAVKVAGGWRTRCASCATCRPRASPSPPSASRARKRSSG
ncbi:MAG: hypothetical protein WDN72_06160 [Alphaproteobacteria bacterium]